MSIVTLGASPRRAELRDAREALQTLAALEAPGAAEELRAVDELIRTLYPRKAMEVVAEPGPDGKVKRRRRSKMIEPQDVMGPCPLCFDRQIDLSTMLVETHVEPDGGSPQGWIEKRHVHASFLPLTDSAARGRGHQRGRPDIPCCGCGGSGRAQIGTAQYRCVQGNVKWKERTPPYEPGPLHNIPFGPAFIHSRGLIGRNLIGARTVEERIVRRSWRDARCTADSADVSAQLEAQARRFFSANGLTDYPRNAKKMGSRRDKKNLTPRQERRVKMDRRVRRMNALRRRAANVAAGVYSKPRLPKAADLLKAMGVDVSGLALELKRLPPPIELEPDLIAQARRMGDLPPDEPTPAEAAVRRLSKAPSRLVNHRTPMSARIAEHVEALGGSL